MYCSLLSLLSIGSLQRINKKLITELYGIVGVALRNAQTLFLLILSCTLAKLLLVLLLTKGDLHSCIKVHRCTVFQLAFKGIRYFLFCCDFQTLSPAFLYFCPISIGGNLIIEFPHFRYLLLITFQILIYIRYLFIILIVI